MAQEMAHYRHLALRVIHQATRRVLWGEPLSNNEKIFSIFEPHTELLKRGKAGKPIEFGHYPATVAADKGYYENMAAIRSTGEKVELVSIAKKGKRSKEKSMHQADPEFRFAQRFRAGIEGTISYLKRILGLFRCFTKGWEHFVSTVGATIFTHNLLILARE